MNIYCIESNELNPSILNYIEQIYSKLSGLIGEYYVINFNDIKSNGTAEAFIFIELVRNIASQNYHSLIIYK